MLSMKLKDIKHCKYCLKPVSLISTEWLTCTECSNCVHVLCLKRQSTPGGLHGDVFFKFTCAECSYNGTEIFLRGKMTWFQTLVLVMHHLQNKSPGIAACGFFHWRNHIITFIDKNWDVLFNADFKRKKNWTGTISGSLSHYSPYFFTSGSKILGEPGWWRLTFPRQSPSVIVAVNSELLAEKNIKQHSRFDFQGISEDINHDIKRILNKFYSYEELNEISPAERSSIEVPFILSNEIDWSACFSQTDYTDRGLENATYIHNNFNLADALENVNFEALCETTNEIYVCKEKENSEPSLQLVDSSVSSSLLQNSARSNFVSFWQKQHRSWRSNERFTLLSTDQEKLLLQYLEKKSGLEWQRLKRKLITRSIKRQHCVNLFDIESWIQTHDTNRMLLTRNKENCYGLGSSYKIGVDIRLAGGSMTDINTCSVSPYTTRILKPYIRRDKNIVPPWLHLMLEVQLRAAQINNLQIMTTRAPLDYCYIKPNHIPAINSLCEQFFWPGIDLAEALEYPDFTCVVLYRKLIVGFAVMVPDVKFNEAYISYILIRPGWRRCGIASFMIYHLIQTCMGKDITLDVSIDNPAIFLYQKFGFKVEQVVLNFYERYIREDTKQSKHSFFLRLER